MSRDSPKKALTDHRRRMIIRGLASGLTKTKIASQLNVHRRTINRWIKDDTGLAAAVEEAERDIYDRAVEEFDTVAFARTEITASVKCAALIRIIDRFEAKQAREQGEITILGLQKMVASICEVLEEHPAARNAVLAACRAGPMSLQEGEP